MYNSNFLGMLKNKKGIITGIANKLSIAYEIAKITSLHQATLAISYQSDIFQKRILPIIENINVSILDECNVSDEKSLDLFFDKVEKKLGSIDFLVHSIAFSDKKELQGRYIDTSLENFTNTMNISCYSLIALAKRAEKLMKNGGSILTMTYYGSNKVIPNYNVMGVAKAALESSVRYLAYDLGSKNIRVNAISSGPIKTLAASGIENFKSMLNTHTEISPLFKSTTQTDVSKSALYFLSELSSGVTGEIHFVDNGYNIMGMTKKNI